jgi:hypothetical protein
MIHMSPTRKERGATHGKLHTTLSRSLTSTSTSRWRTFPVICRRWHAKWPDDVGLQRMQLSKIQILMIEMSPTPSGAKSTPVRHRTSTGNFRHITADYLLTELEVAR